MSVASPPGQPSWSDVNRDVIRTVGMPGKHLLRLDVLHRARPRLRGDGVGVADLDGAWARRASATPQMWAMYITTFVFWIGIGHAGTLISAVALPLPRESGGPRSIAGAEAMTVLRS